MPLRDVERFRLSPEERVTLAEILKFQKPRGFRYGKPLRYLRHPEVVPKLERMGLVFVKAPYRDKRRYRYVFLTKLGRAVAFYIMRSSV